MQHWVTRGLSNKSKLCSNQRSFLPGGGVEPIKVCVIGYIYPAVYDLNGSYIAAGGFSHFP